MRFLMVAAARRLRFSTAVVAALVAGVVAQPHDAHAQQTKPDKADKTAEKSEKATCLEAMSRGQTLRDSHKLLEARDRFRVCARAVCPTLVQNDCGGWLSDVERTLPTMVVTAHSSAGGDLYAVKVSMDGHLLLASLDGEAMPVNPGLHTFHFESAGMVPTDRQALVKEGGKEQSVVGVLTPVAPPPPPPKTVLTTPPTTSSGSGVRTAGFILGGIGIAGLAAGAVAGILALSAKSSDCPDDVCKPGDKSTVTTDAHISTAGFIAGGVLLAAGAGMVIFAPRSANAHPETALRLVPIFGSGGAGAGGGAGLKVGSSF